MSEPTEPMPGAANTPTAPADPTLDAFVELIDRAAGFEEDLHPEWVDGFMTALVVGPRVVTPSDWIPVVFDDFDRVFADPADAGRAMEVLMARWNAIALSILPNRLAEDPDTLHLRPLIYTMSDDQRAELARQPGVDADQVADQTLDAQVWACGFLDALEAFAVDWQPPRKDREAADYLRLAVASVEAVAGTRQDAAGFLAAHYPRERMGRDDLIDEMLFHVQELRLFWLEHGHKPEPIRATAKPGRNEPCHCGSGRKFKHCHGAAA